MKSQPQNPEFRIHPENFHPCFIGYVWFHCVDEKKNVDPDQLIWNAAYSNWNLYAQIR